MDDATKKRAVQRYQQYRKEIEQDMEQKRDDLEGAQLRAALRKLTQQKIDKRQRADVQRSRL